MKQIAPYLILFPIFFLLISNFAFAQGLIPSCNPVGPKGDAGTCNLCHVLQLIQNVINYMIQLGVALAALFFSAGAFVILTAGGSEEKLKKGKTMLTVTVTGLVILLTSWIIVGSFVKIITQQSSYVPWGQIDCKLYGKF